MPAIPLLDTNDEDNITIPTANPDRGGDTSISELVDARIVLIIKEPAFISGISQRLDLSTMVFKKVEISKNIAYDAEKIRTVQDRDEQLPANIVADTLKEMDSQTHNQAAEMKKHSRL